MIRVGWVGWNECYTNINTQVLKVMMSKSQEYKGKLLAHSFRHFSVHDGAIEGVQ
jgi:hypothetical protein